MYFLLEKVDFHCQASLPEGNMIKIHVSLHRQFSFLGSQEEMEDGWKKTQTFTAHLLKKNKKQQQMNQVCLLEKQHFQHRGSADQPPLKWTLRQNDGGWRINSSRTMRRFPPPPRPGREQHFCTRNKSWQPLGKTRDEKLNF